MFRSFTRKQFLSLINVLDNLLAYVPALKLIFKELCSLNFITWTENENLGLRS
jgi:hypothetical protein